MREHARFIDEVFGEIPRRGLWVPAVPVFVGKPFEYFILIIAFYNGAFFSKRECNADSPVSEQVVEAISKQASAQ